MANGQEWALGVRELPPPDDRDGGDHPGGNPEAVAPLVPGDVVDRE